MNAFVSESNININSAGGCGEPVSIIRLNKNWSNIVRSEMSCRYVESYNYYLHFIVILDLKKMYAARTVLAWAQRSKTSYS